jgi:DNA invertase Pin-like site-specific DNA recombinase
MKPRQTDARKVIGYIRVSTDEQTLGPQVQRTALARWCQQHGAELVDVHADQGISGGADVEARPGLMAAIATLKTHGAGVLLVAKRDRLARDNYVNAMIHRLVERSGATVRSADGSGDGDGPEAVLMRRIVEAFAEYERLLIQARTRAALAVKRARNERVGAPPYGWRLAADGVRLEADPAEQATVARVQQYRREGLTLREIGERLASEGVAPRAGGRWHPQTIANMVKGRLAA